MSNDELRERLRLLGREANSLTDETLNCGGCCVFASLVADALTRLRISHEVVADACFGGWGATLPISKVRPENDSDDPTTWHDNNVHFRHVGVRIICEGEAWLFDSDGLYDPDSRDLNGWSLSEGALTDDEARMLAGAGFMWNPMFDRDYIPHLQALVDKHLLQPLDRSEDDKLLAELGVTP